MDNINVSLSNRLFTYVKHGIDITEDMKNIYSNSLMLIGDEKQLYIPVLNAYVGIGEARIQRIEKLIENLSASNYLEDIEILQNTPIGNNYFTYAITSIQKDTNNSTSSRFRMTYQIAGLPTKKYVDEAITNSQVTLSGSAAINGKKVITNAYLNTDTNTIAYTYSSLSASATGIKNTLAVSEGTNLTNILNPNNLNKGIDVITGVKVEQDGLETKVSYSYTKIYASSNHHSQNGSSKEANHVITNINLSETGQLSYTTYNLSGTMSLTYGFITSIKQNAMGHITAIGGNILGTTYNESSGKLSTDSSNKQRVVTYSYLSNSGELHLEYKDIYTDPQDYTYHHLELAQISPVKNTVDFTYAIVGISTTNNDINANKHVVSYQVLAVPTKKYVDDKVQNSLLTLTNTGTISNNNSVVITNTYLSNTGQYSYTYSSLSASATGTVNSLLPSDKTNTLSNILNPDNLNRGIDVITGITVTTDKLETKISYTYTSIYASKDHHSTEISHGVNVSNLLIGNVHLSESGQLSYTTVNLSNSKTQGKGFIYAFNQDSLGNITATGRDFSNNHVRSNAVKLSTTSQDANKYVSYTYLTDTGELYVAYSYLYVEPTNDFAYHEFGITQKTPQGDNNFAYAIIGISTDNDGNATSHTVSYQIAGLPTKKYVDDLIQANDALRYCGTVKPSSTVSGNITLSHESSAGTAHGTTPDTSRGAVYKVSESGYIGSAYVVASDTLISYLDNASSNTATGWNIINGNVDLRTGTPASQANPNSSTRVLTNVSINNSGTLSYTYTELAAETNRGTINNPTSGLITKQSSSTNYNLSTSETNKGFPVITKVELTQDGATTKLSYSYSYIYASTVHHSVGTHTKANETIKLTYSTPKSLVTNVTLSSTGTLTYTYTDIIVEEAYRSTYSTYSEYSVGLDSIIYNGTSGVVTDIYIDNAKKLNVSYTNLSTASDNTYNFIKSVSQGVTGKVSTTGGTFGNTKNTGTKYLSNSSYNFVTAVKLGTDGKLSYDLISVTITDSYTYNAVLSANGTVINITGTTGGNGSRTYSYITPDYLYTYLHNTSTYLFMQNGKIANKLNVGSGGIESVGSISTENHLSVTGNTTLGAWSSTYTDVKGNLTVENKLYTYNSAYLGNDSSDFTYTYELDVRENAHIINNLLIDGNTYLGNTATNIIYINGKEITLNSNNTALSFTGLKQLWGTIS